MRYSPAASCSSHQSIGASTWTSIVTILADDLRRLRADRFGGRDERADHDQAGVIEHPGHLGHAAQMLGQVRRAEIQLAAQAVADILALQDQADRSELEQLLFERVGDLDLAAPGEPGQPDRDGLLSVPRRALRRSDPAFVAAARGGPSPPPRRPCARGAGRPARGR